MPQRVLIHTEDNNFQHLEVLSRNRVKRLRHREIFVEGVPAIRQLLQQNWPVKALVYSQETRLSDWARETIQTSTAASHYELPTRLMAKLSQKDKPSELLAIAAMPQDDLARISLHPTSLLIILDRPTNPGNLGAVLRSADAFGADGIIITGHAVDPYDPKTIGASRGAIFTVPIVRVETNQALFDWLAGARQSLPSLQIVGTSAQANSVVTNQTLRPPLILMMGNETTGLRKSYQDLCDKLSKIPMNNARSTTSLNVAVATSIFLYEVMRSSAQEKPDMPL